MTNNLKEPKKYPLSSTYWNMRGRCYKPNHTSYKNYGAKGIRVCDRWLEPNKKGFQNFVEDMGERPEGYTIERIDGKANYSPDNCKWATPREQQNNRSNNVRIEIDGVTKSVSAWARENGVTINTAFARIWYGMNPVEAVTRPVRRIKPTSEWKGKK